MTRLTMVIAAAAALLAAPALAGPAPAGIKMVDADGKSVARTAAGDMPVYTFDKDAAGKSNCNDKCAAAWPPVAAKADDAAVGDWSVVKRDDGSAQWAFKGKPVYTFAKDTAGKATGDGVGGVWHVLAP